MWRLSDCSTRWNVLSDMATVTIHSAVIVLGRYFKWFAVVWFSFYTTFTQAFMLCLCPCDVLHLPERLSVFYCTEICCTMPTGYTCSVQTIPNRDVHCVFVFFVFWFDSIFQWEKHFSKHKAEISEQLLCCSQQIRISQSFISKFHCLGHVRKTLSSVL